MSKSLHRCVEPRRREVPVVRVGLKTWTTWMSRDKHPDWASDQHRHQVEYSTSHGVVGGGKVLTTAPLPSPQWEMAQNKKTMSKLPYLCVQPSSGVRVRDLPTIATRAHPRRELPALCGMGHADCTAVCKWGNEIVVCGPAVRHSTAAAQSQHGRSTVTAQSQHGQHRTVTAQSQHSHITVASFGTAQRSAQWLATHTHRLVGSGRWEEPEGGARVVGHAGGAGWFDWLVVCWVVGAAWGGIDARMLRLPS